MRNLIFYEFLNFGLVGTGAIAFETAKIAYTAGATENKHFAQDGYTTLDFLAISQFRIIYSF